MFALERASVLKYGERKREVFLRNNLRALTKEECDTPGLYKDEIRKIKSQVKIIDQDRHHGALRARAEKLLLGEAPTYRSMEPEKRHACRKHIAVIEKGGVVFNDQA